MGNSRVAVKNAKDVEAIQAGTFDFNSQRPFITIS
jgi:hypothetical protein